MASAGEKADVHHVHPHIMSKTHVHFLRSRDQPDGEGADGEVAVIVPTSASSAAPMAANGYLAVMDPEAGLAAQTNAEEVETRPNRARSMSRVEQEEFLTASTWRIAAEIALPFLIAGIGMVCAGLLLDYFTKVRALLRVTGTSTSTQRYKYSYSSNMHTS